MNNRLLIGSLLFCVLLSGCAKREQHLCPCPEGKQLDQELMLLLSSARAFHHQADILLQQGKVDQAMDKVEQVLKLGLKPRWPEAVEVRLDATARLAKLLQAKGEVPRALALVKEALKQHEKESFYLSNLHGVQGEILQHRSKELDRAGEKEEARQWARRAMAAFERSIAINKRLQQQLSKKGAR